jgi:hypothetical protein
MAGDDSRTKGGLPLSDVPKLESPEDWEDFHDGIMDYLVLNDHWRFLEKHLEEPERASYASDRTHTTALEDWQYRQQLALRAIGNRLGYNARAMVKGVKSAKACLDTLEASFKPRGDGMFNELSNRFFDLALQEYKDVAEYTRAFRKLENQLQSLNSYAVLPQSWIIQRYLKGLGPSYSVFQTTFMQTHRILPDIDGKGAVTFNETSLAVLNEEKRITAQEDSQAHAMVAHSLGSSASADTINVPYCTHCKRAFHTEHQCHLKHPELKTQFEKERGSRGQGRKRQRRDKDSSKVDTSHDDDVVAMMAHTTANRDLSLQNLWAIDSACSRHLTHSRSQFVDYTPLPPAALTVSGIGGSNCQPIGHGTVKLECNENNRRVVLHLSNVFHVPDSGVNLISVSQLLDLDADVRFSKTSCSIKYKCHSFTGSGKNGLWFLNLIQQSPIAFSAYRTSTETIRLWHRRMGHLGEQNLKKLATMSTGIDLTKPPDDTEVCEACVLTKMRSVPHKGTIQAGKYPMELIHTDLMGPMEVAGYNGARYVATFLCDATQKSEVYTVKHKNELFACFKRFRETHERADMKVHRLRMDNGGEYTSIEFKNYLSDNGIAPEYTVPGNPQQNGKSERLGGIIWKKAKAFLRYSGLPLKYWPEMVNTANYVRNRSPCASLPGITPFQAWTGREPTLSHIKTPGTTCWSINRLHSKLKDDATECKLLGYEGDHIYRLLHPNGKIFTSSTVHFGKEKRSLEEDDYNDCERQDMRQSKRLCMPTATSGPSACGSKGAVEWNLNQPASVPSHSFECEHWRVPEPLQPRTPSQPHLSSPLTTPGTTPTSDVFPGVSPSNRAITPLEIHQPRARAAKTTPYHPLTRDMAATTSLMALLASAGSVEPYEPATYQEAMAGDLHKQWELAMKDEVASLQENDTWGLTTLPPSRTALRASGSIK